MPVSSLAHGSHYTQTVRTVHSILKAPQAKAVSCKHSQDTWWNMERPLQYMEQRCRELIHTLSSRSAGGGPGGGGGAPGLPWSLESTSNTAGAASGGGNGGGGGISPDEGRRKVVKMREPKRRRLCWRARISAFGAGMEGGGGCSNRTA